jgi:hypothetical protein
LGGEKVLKTSCPSSSETHSVSDLSFIIRLPVSNRDTEHSKSRIPKDGILKSSAAGH